MGTRSHPGPPAGPSLADPPLLRHDALLYAGEAEYADLVGRFVRGGVAAGEPVLVAVPPPAAAVLREALGPIADEVELVDMTRVGRNPGRIIPFVQAWSDAQPQGPRRFVGEPVWPGREPDAAAEARRHDALLNVAFASTDVHILCPYDAARLDPQVVAGAGQTHPTLNCHGVAMVSDAYADPFEVGAGAAAPLRPAPAGALAVPVTRDLAATRGLVAAQARAAGLPRGRVEALLQAANEAVTNTLVHGGEPGVLRLWRRDGELVCEVADRGWIRDPLAGRRAPDVERDHGRGLWLVNQLCDLVELRYGPDGTALRVHMRVP